MIILHILIITRLHFINRIINMLQTEQPPINPLLRFLQAIKTCMLCHIWKMHQENRIEISNG